MELEWSWNGVGVELEWSWNGVGMELELDGVERLRLKRLRD